ncbi:MAG: hypothetical protein CL678_14265 [Bdellovibrionaceae bacterium]|nr:hypothetical protein [Pseudobdellovibrionaceae bacterium]|tara:strand:- start:294 stop:743 length:450 start_codon:yes stop_codon:yes gene_type:complete
MNYIFKALLLGVFTLSQVSCASVTTKETESKNPNHIQKEGSPPEIVKWIGTVGAGSFHTTVHLHDMEFTRQSDGETYDIVDSPKLENEHCRVGKKLLVEIEAEQTPRFLFWGGNLIVKNFTVLEELGAEKHRIPRQLPAHEFGGSGDRK